MVNSKGEDMAEIYDAIVVAHDLTTTIMNDKRIDKSVRRELCTAVLKLDNSLMEMMMVDIATRAGSQ